MKQKIFGAGLLVLVALAFFFSCKSKDKSINPEFGKYIYAFTSGNIHNSSSIEIQLTQDVPNVEAGQIVEEKLFNFTPSIKGEAQWKNTNTIIFTPEKDELKPGTSYDAWFKLGKVLDIESKFDEFYFNFNIPEQNFDLALGYYTPMYDSDLSWNKVRGTLRLANDADIESVKKMLSIEGKGAKDARINLIAGSTIGSYNISIDSLLRSETDSMVYTLNVDGSKIGIKKSEQYKIIIPGMPEFNVLDAEIVYEPQECIRITFSDPLSQKQNILGLIKVSTSKNYSYELDKNELKLYVDSESGQEVTITVHKEVKNSMNKPLGKDYTFNLTFEKHEPLIKLIGDANILPNSGKLTIPFRAVNLWAVDAYVVKVYENNILHYLQTNDFGENNELKRFGKLVMKKCLRLDTDPTLKLDRWNTFNLDLSKLIEKDPGAIYKVEFRMKKEYSTYPCYDEDGERQTAVNRNTVLSSFDEELTPSEEQYWESPGYYYLSNIDWSVYDWDDVDNPCTPSYYMDRIASCFVLSSNIGITAKQGSAKNMFVALNNIVTTDPIADATIKIYNYQMQVIGTATTDSEGFAMIDYEDGVPFAIIAESGTDKGYLKVSSNLSLSLSNFDVSGKTLKKGLKGYIYGERGVWRPGDSIYITFVLEDRELSIPQDHPATLELYTPLGQLYKTYVATGTNGFYPFRMATNEDAITGAWRANIKIGGVDFSQRVRIETVKPNRLKVRLNMDDIVEASSRSFTATLSSQWLHGAPASNLKSKVEMTLSKASTPFEGYQGYVFNNPASTFSGDTYDLFEGRLDQNGETTVQATLPGAQNAPGMLKANFISRVFESGGDASIYTQVVPYSPFSSYVGVRVPRSDNGRWLETDRNYQLDIVTVNSKGKPTDRKNMDIKIYKIDWSWWWNSNREDLSSYVNSSSTKIVYEKNFSTTGGKAKVDFKVEYPDWGRYLVMVNDKESGHSAGQVIYMDWPAYMGRSNKADPKGLTMLSFSTDKEQYNVGDEVTVILPKSSNGRALISIEDGSRILSKTWVKVSADGDTKHTFKVTEEMAPNFYIFASLFQPHGQTNNELPIRMYGVLNIKAENKETILNPVINMPNELRPEREYTISVSEANKKDMTYTLAVVDDGLLDLTSFKTPNAWNDFYARQALGVRTWDMYDYVVGTLTGKMGPLISIGGDEALKPQDSGMKRFKPVVEYIGPFHLSGGKTNKHTLKMPPYFGSVRVMVVAGNPEKAAYGNAEKTVPVKNPLMILSTLPRVAGPGEEIMLPVNIFSMDDKIKSVDVSVKSSGMFEFIGGSSQKVNFSEKGDKTIFFKLKVANKVGQEKVEIVAKANGESATETINIEIRNPNPPILLSQDALIEAGQSANLTIAMDAPSPKQDWVKLELSRMPGLDLNRSLKFLLDYPHGCTEQVTSRAFPALLVGKFREFTPKEQETMKANVRAAINILTSRQLSSGAFSYWPGGSYANEWASTYATHFLIEAEKAGYNVPSSVKSKALNCLKTVCRQWNGNPIYSSYYSESMSALQQAYRLYILALANEPELGAMNRLKETSNLSTQAKWRLAATYGIAGRKDAAKQIIASASTKVDNYSFSNDTYGSSARDMAMIMETQVILDDVKGALKIARDIAESVSKSSYLTTQTTAYNLIALSKLADKLGGGSAITYEWELNGVKQKSNPAKKVYQEINIEPQSSINVKLQNIGEGTLYARLTGMTQPLVNRLPAENKGVVLSVKYEDTNYNPINVASLKQGTEFYAIVTLRNAKGTFLSDLTLSQIFPSGWEIFNTRLFDEAASSNSNAGAFNYQDIRDDRVYTYFNLGSGQSTTFKVRLQAAYRGKFYLPAVTCEAMYDPEEQSRTTGSWIEVVE